ncbi:MAG TPA: FAD-binding oxidoreductase [Patescibacteria group bacterium]|nr:FAD-binding oxidoreductase [Patescibacteria group bacterium]
MMNTTWSQEQPLKQHYPRLSENINTDIAIVGGGISGLVTGYLLAQTGKKIVLVEKDIIGSGETAHTTAFITAAFDTSLQERVSWYNKTTATVVWQSGQKAIDTIEKIITTEHIDCDFVRSPAFIYALNKQGAIKLQEEAHLAQEFKMNAHFYQDTVLPFQNAGYLRIENQAKFQPLKFITALAKKIHKQGVFIFENTEVTNYIGKNHTTIHTKGADIHAQDIIIATHNPNNLPFEIHNRIIPTQTYVIEAHLPKNTFPEAMFWDTEEPCHYFRIEKINNYDRMILGGADQPID